MVDYGWGAQQTYGNVVRKKTEPAATLAFIAALGTPFSWGVSGIFALVLAPRAKRSIAESPETRRGAGLALAAQIIAGTFLAITVLALLLLVIA